MAMQNQLALIYALPENPVYKDLPAWRTKYNDYLLPASHVISILTGVKLDIAPGRYRNLKTKYPCFVDDGDVVKALDNGPLTKFAYKYQVKQGQPTTVITLPGLEKLCQTLPGIVSEETKVLFLQAVDWWKTQSGNVQEAQQPSQLQIDLETSRAVVIWGEKTSNGLQSINSNIMALERKTSDGFDTISSNFAGAMTSLDARTSAGLRTVASSVSDAMRPVQLSVAAGATATNALRNEVSIGVRHTVDFKKNLDDLKKELTIKEKTNDRQRIAISKLNDSNRDLIKQKDVLIKAKESLIQENNDLKKKLEKARGRSQKSDILEPFVEEQMRFNELSRGAYVLLAKNDEKLTEQNTQLLEQNAKILALLKARK